MINKFNNNQMSTQKKRITNKYLEAFAMENDGVFLTYKDIKKQEEYSAKLKEDYRKHHNITLKPKKDSQRSKRHHMTYERKSMSSRQIL